MAPIEVFFGAIVLIFALIGLVRGFLRELGVTTVMMFLLFFLSRFETQIDKGIVRVMGVNALQADDLERLVQVRALLMERRMALHGDRLPFMLYFQGEIRL